MPTLSELINEVGDDIQRTDLTAQCSAAVVTAIRHYDHKRWWFAEGSATFTTTSNTSIYTLPTDYRATDYIECRWPGDNYQRLRPRDFPHVKRMLEGSPVVTGYPEVYAIRDEKLWLAYQPNGAYQVRHYYRRTLADLTGAASNAWTTDCRDLIRAHAAKQVALRTLHDGELATMFELIRGNEERALISENQMRTSHGKIKPHY